MKFVVEVNEGVVEATGRGNNWWQARRPMLVASGLLREIKPACMVGGTVEISTGSRDDAEFMAGHMVASGMPASAVKVKKRKETQS